MVFKCPKGDRIFTRVPHRWCPLCEKDYVPTEKSAEELTEHGYIEDCEENQWLFFDLPLKRAAQEPTVTIDSFPGSCSDDDTLTLDEVPPLESLPRRRQDTRTDQYPGSREKYEYTTKDGPLPYWLLKDQE